jgi:alpha-glucosidase
MKPCCPFTPRFGLPILAAAALFCAGVRVPANPVAGDAPVYSANVPASGFARWRVEAVAPGVARLWLKPRGEFVRERSLAMSPESDSRIPLTEKSGPSLSSVRAGALEVRLYPETLRFEVHASDASPLLSGASIILGQDGSSWSFSCSLDDEERLLGLGQDNLSGGRLDRRGSVRELWAGQRIESGNVTAEYPVPLLLSTGRKGHAYGIFFDNVHRLNFDLAKTKPGEILCAADGGEIDLYVIDGPRLSDVLERYSLLTGRPSLPPLWALGYWQSKCTYYDWEALDTAYGELDRRGFPVDVMVIDADWPETLTNYRWAPRWLKSASGKTPEEKIEDYAKRGVRIVMSQSGPMIRQNASNYESGLAAGVFASDGKGNPVECGYYGGKLLDFTHPRMNDWLWPQTRRINESGVAGWWLDLTEPEGEPPQTHYYGGRPANVHNQYSLLCTRSFEGVQLAVNPDRRPFILTRSGSAGLQRHHAAVWTGDIYSDYATLRAHPPEMLNSGLSGLAWWTCDTGGFLTGYYRQDQFGAHAQLYQRWMQFSAFSPIVRSHKAGGAPEPYQFGPTVEQNTRHYLKLRYRLLPYIYSYAWETSQTGAPLVRPLLFDYPGDPRAVAAAGDEYLFGRELLVAPAMFEGQTTRKVYFPPGRWIDWDYGYEYAGGRDWVVAAPPNRIPVAVRAGAIIPLAPDMRNTAEKGWDPLTLEIFPEGRSRFTLYRDDGVSFAYTRGDYTLTTFEVEERDVNLELRIAATNTRFLPGKYLAHFHLGRTPLAVRVDGAPLQRSSASLSDTAEWTWDAEARVLTVPVGAGGTTQHRVGITLQGRLLEPRHAPELKEAAVDEKAEVSGSNGNPLPHFFPAPQVPSRIRACNYDKGGEGVAFHLSRSLPSAPLYRTDDIGLVPTEDAGGGFVLAGLQPDEWIRYTVDCSNGGFFNLVLRVAGTGAGGRLRFLEEDREIAAVVIPATGGGDNFRDILIPDVYLAPGVHCLLLFVDAPGFVLSSFEFSTTKSFPRVYPAPLALRSGVADLIADNTGYSGRGAVRNLGRLDSSVTFGIMSQGTGPARLRLHYRGSAETPLPYEMHLNSDEPVRLSIASTKGEWRTLDVPVVLQTGANKLVLAGLVDGWDSIMLDSIEVLTP